MSIKLYKFPHKYSLKDIVTNTLILTKEFSASEKSTYAEPNGQIDWIISNLNKDLVAAKDVLYV